MFKPIFKPAALAAVLLRIMMPAFAQSCVELSCVTWAINSPSPVHVR